MMHWPDGKTFAFTIFEDSDFQTPARAAAVYDFLADLGIKTTKGVWPGHANIPPDERRVTCLDADYLKWTGDPSNGDSKSAGTARRRSRQRVKRPRPAGALSRAFRPSAHFHCGALRLSRKYLLGPGRLSGRAPPWLYRRSRRAIVVYSRATFPEIRATGAICSANTSSMCGISYSPT